MKRPDNTDEPRIGILSFTANSIFRRLRKAYHKGRESWGYPKREVVVYRVIKARDSLESAKTQFESALEKFSTVSDFQGGALQDQYLHLKHQLECSEHHAVDVSNRIRAVEDVSNTLFEEWQQELGEYNSRQLRSNSRQQLNQARKHYNRLMKAMRKAESKIDPVLSAFRDQVLFMKHNLNAQAIASLHHDLRAIGIDIASLIVAMEKSIVEANTFVNSVNNQKSLPCN